MINVLTYHCGERLTVAGDFRGAFLKDLNHKTGYALGDAIPLNPVLDMVTYRFGRWQSRLSNSIVCESSNIGYSHLHSLLIANSQLVRDFTMNRRCAFGCQRSDASPASGLKSPITHATNTNTGRCAP